MSAVLDPAVALALRTGFVLLFAAAAVHKLRSPRAFRAAMAGYDVLPVRLVPAIASMLIAAEILAVLALVGRPALGGALAAALLVLYAAALAVALARGRAGVDCGCSADGAPVQGGLVVRNLLLGAAALPLLAPASERPLGWMDVVTVLGAVATAGALLAATNALLATRPYVAALRQAREGA